MPTYRRNKGRSALKWLFIILGSLAAIIMLAAIFLVVRYGAALQPVSDDKTNKQFTIASGDSLNKIASGLKTDDLIRSPEAFRFYVFSNRLQSKLQAGTYTLSPSMSTKVIVEQMTSGKVTPTLVTILPGRRVDQIREDLIQSGFSTEEVDIALDPSQYKDLPVIAHKPAGIMTLEGLLWPESFHKDSTTAATDIIRKSLVAMGDNLTPEVLADFNSRGLKPYEGLVLASVVEKEGSKQQDRPIVAQVFLTRMQKGMNLGSDPTAEYGAVMAGLKPNLTYDSPYNTRLHAGLPPTPIGTISAEALNAVRRPAASSWLYFVTGDDGTTYFSNTLKEHEAYTAKYCHRLCGP